MSAKDHEALCTFLADNGLSPSDWVETFQREGLISPHHVQAREGDKEVYEALCNGASCDDKETLSNIFKLEVSQQKPSEDITPSLAKVGLDVTKWSRIFKEELGIQSSEALQNVGEESYQSLVKFVSVPWEKKALRRLLNIERNFENQRKKNREKLDRRQAESGELLKALTQLQNEGKHRLDEDVMNVEKMFRERLQVPESVWLTKDANLTEVIAKMKAIHSNTDCPSSETKEEDDSLVVAKASGGLALRGVLITEKPSDAVTPRQKVLKLPEGIRLDGPQNSQYDEIKQFQSQSSEEEFSKQVEMFGYSVSAAVKGGLWGVSAEVGSSYAKRNEEEESKAHYCERAYTSTIKYSFMPLASYSFEEHKLKISEDALAHLHNIDKCLSRFQPVHEECAKFFELFGSHVFAGPLHFGGRFMWKSYSSGYKESEKLEVQALQSEAISAHMSISYGNIAGAAGAVNVANMSGSLKRDYSQTLTSQTFLQVKITGGPPNATCLPDWKNGLVRNNSTWHLIDRGVFQVPIWDIIEKNHKHDFKSSAQLTTTLKEKWKKLYCTLHQDEEALSDEVKSMIYHVSSWTQNPDETQFEEQLSSLVDLKERVARSHVNPTTWAKKYLSQEPLKDFLGVIVHSCMKGSDELSKRLKRYMRLLVEPIDLDITRVFPNEKATLKWLYNTEEPHPPISCRDFLMVDKYFQMALEKVHSEDPLLHDKGYTSALLPSQLAISVTTMVAKAVFSLRSYLWKTNQVYEDCFLTTMLYPFKYDPEKCRFVVLMTRIDIKHICETFSKESETFFVLMMKKSLPNVQSYLFSLTVKLYDSLDVSEHHVKCHLQYLQNQLQVCSELEGIILKLESSNYDWEQFGSELESFNDTSLQVNTAGASLQSILEENQGIPDHVMEKQEPFNIAEDKVVTSLFLKLGLLKSYTEKLTLSDAITIREDTLNPESTVSQVSGESDAITVKEDTLNPESTVSQVSSAITVREDTLNPESTVSQVSSESDAITVREDTLNPESSVSHVSSESDAITVREDTLNPESTVSQVSSESDAITVKEDTQNPESTVSQVSSAITVREDTLNPESTVSQVSSESDAITIREDTLNPESTVSQVSSESDAIRVKEDTQNPESTVSQVSSAITVREDTLNPESTVSQVSSESDAITIREDTLNPESTVSQVSSESDAIRVREDTLNPESTVSQVSSESDARIYPFCILQNIMAFNHRCRIPFYYPSSNASESDSDSDSSSGSDEICVKTIHPMDGLLALIHCSDNFLRQNLFSRLATCQLAVPLLLPDPMTHDPVFLLWAMRTIVKEFRVDDGNTLFCGPIINYPAPIVSFLRIGKHTVSKSELMNSVINTTKHDTFVHYNCEGGSAERVLVNGLVEVSWYLPSKNEKIFPNAITFANLHGDACYFAKQTKLLCEVSSMSFILLNETGMTADGLKLLKGLSRAPGGVVILQTSHSTSKSLQKQLKKEIPDRKKCSIIELHGINEAERRDSIRKKIIANLKDVGGQSLSLEVIAHKCGILLDEDDPECKRGKESAEEFQSLADEFQKSHPGESPKILLALQRNKLWHKWAEFDKEQHRQQRRGQRSMEEYGALLRKKMNQIRKAQLQNAKNITPMLTSFLSTILTHQGKVLWYYLHWVKLYLDNLSRMLLPPLHDQYREKREQLGDIQMQEKRDEIAEKECRREMNILNLALIDASFGMEHLLREVSQMYEAVILHDDAPTDIKNKVTCLPQIAAQLLFDGFPMELLDGDAAHMPKQWVSAVLQSLATILNEKMKNPRVFVLSVLGLQSTGKSTMLNTLFGVQFSVSAGRCTRGAFMQLIPVHHSLSKKCGVQYFLLIDTEGLRAPELDTLQTQKHDNELATFVIGMANLTIVNVRGELSGDMDDILQTAVHAFLRMKEVNLKPSCHFVHQNVGDIAAKEKLMMGRFKMKDKLDGMTLEAAKETGLENEVRFFNQVINFTYQEDVSFFPSLWIGSPPMSPVSPDYSAEAQTLKHLFIKLLYRDTTMTRSNTIEKLGTHLRELWKAILQEDFVFSFRNTFEIAAYKALEDQYETWSWNFKKAMIEWKQKAQSRLVGCKAELLVSTYEELTASLTEDIGAMHTKYEAQMNTFFEQSDEREIISQWKHNTETKLQHLKETQKQRAENHCRQLYQGRKDRAVTEKKKETLATDIIERVQQLVVHVKRVKMDKEDIERKFQESWIGWMGQLTSSVEKVILPNVAHEVQITLEDCLTSQDQRLLKQRLSKKTLGNWGKHLKLLVSPSHIKLQGRVVNFMKRLIGYDKKIEDFTPLAQLHTDILLIDVSEYLTKTKESDKNFNPEFTTEMIRNLLLSISQLKFDDFKLTDEYRVDMCLTSCGYAIKVFEEMAENFRKEHDPVEYIERDMKPYCRKLFMDKYNQIAKEKTVAEALCVQLKEPLRRYVIVRLSTGAADDTRHNLPWIRSKKSLIGHILLDMGLTLHDNMDGNYDFSDCEIFLQQADASLKCWIRHYTGRHCGNALLSKKALTELLEAIHFISTKAKEVANSFSQGPTTFYISDWLTEFHKECLDGMLEVELSKLCLLGGNEEFQNVRFFSDEVVNGLKVVSSELRKDLEGIQYSTMIAFGVTPHDEIFDQVVGCTQQCPFCKAQCEHTNDTHPNSVKHSVEHRPQCLGGYHWKSDQTMILDICTALVSSDRIFLDPHINNEWHPYKDYTKFYPDWKIAADVSLESSSFWKWLVGHFAKDIQTLYGQSETWIYPEWKELEWRKVMEDIKESYDLK